ncbi:uncharacterized protein LOC121412670 [Lytechinus variegatus]|uniref:uncharacterized protein LOC121412670 n=1 Tax=Lytechinus variegatus TaxID=7654 RepID=UPI001BB2743B|nr:uncharacterized protein LOC121412670 [Lytechinus variegatus]
MLKTDLMMILLTWILHGISNGEMDVFLTPEIAIISEGETVTLQCLVTDVDHRFYTIKWSNTSHGAPASHLQSKQTLFEGRTINSSLTLWNPGVDFTTLYFCEVNHTTARGGSNLVAFAKSVVSGTPLARTSECHRSSDGDKVIHLYEGGPPVDISCKTLREPIVPELKWRFLQRDGKTGIVSRRYDDGIHRSINSSLEWDRQLDGLVLYCKATIPWDKLVANPCVIGLIRVVQQPRIIPGNTSLGFGFVNEVEYWCDVRGLYRQSCSYTWGCQPNVLGCYSDNDSLIINVNESSSLEKKIEVTCRVECMEDVHREAHANLTIHSESYSQHSRKASAEREGITVSLRLHSDPESDEYLLRCSVRYNGNGMNDEPTFAWYIDGIKQGISDTVDITPNHQQEIHSTYRVDQTFHLVVCDALYDGNITRVWSTFSDMVGASTETINFTTDHSFLQSSPKPAPNDRSSSNISESSLWLVISIGICASLALLIFAWVTFSTLARSRYWSPVNDSKVITFSIKSRRPSDHTDLDLNTNGDERQTASDESLDEYAYPELETNAADNDQRNEGEHFAFAVASGFNNDMDLKGSGYEELPDEISWPPQRADCHLGNDSVQPYQNFALPPSFSMTPPTPPLTHEYSTALSHSNDHYDHDDRESISSPLHHEYHDYF